MFEAADKLRKDLGQNPFEALRQICGKVHSLLAVRIMAMRTIRYGVYMGQVGVQDGAYIGV